MRNAVNEGVIAVKLNARALCCNAKLQHDQGQSQALGNIFGHKGERCRQHGCLGRILIKDATSIMQQSFTHLLTDWFSAQTMHVSKQIKLPSNCFHTLPSNNPCSHWRSSTKVLFDWTTRSKTLISVTTLQAVWQLPWAVWGNPQLNVHRSILRVFRRKQGASWSPFLEQDPRFKTDNS